MVTMSIKAGGADPVSNVQLAKLLEQAKQVHSESTHACIALMELPSGMYAGV